MCASRSSMATPPVAAAHEVAKVPTEKWRKPCAEVGHCTPISDLENYCIEEREDILENWDQFNNN